MAVLRLALAVLLGFVVLSCDGEEAVSGKTEQLVWEWPGDRAPDSRILVRIESVATASGGVSGSVQSPSIAGYLPDPMEVSGSVLAGPDSQVGMTVSLRLPKVEMGELAAGDLAGLGLIGDSTCICVVRAPQNLAADSAEAWLSAMPCGG